MDGAAERLWSESGKLQHAGQQDAAIKYNEQNTILQGNDTER
jgi:hypothetical protein